MSTEARLLLSIIKLGAGQVDVQKVSQDSKVPLSLANESLKKLENKKLIQLSNGRITTSPKQRLGLAILAIRDGVDIEEVCKLLGWGEFEDLVALVLEYNGFSSKKHFRFKTQGRWFEIDVLGWKEPLLLSIDCKHWKRSWQRSATMTIVEKQLQRTEALVNSSQKIGVRIGVTGWEEVRVLPLILTLSKTPLKTYKEVPVVPIFHLQNFLNNEIFTYLDDFRFYEVSQ